MTSIKPFKKENQQFHSYVVLLYHFPWLGEGWDPANMFNPATWCMYVCACSKSGACNSVVVVCLCVTYLFFVHFLYIDKAVNFLVWIVLHCHFGAINSWLCGMGVAHCWRPFGDLYLLIAVSFWSLMESCLIGNNTTSFLKV